MTDAPMTAQEVADRLESYPSYLIRNQFLARDVATAIALLRNQAEAAQNAPAANAQPSELPKFECWSANDGDSWREHPADADLVDGLKVGDTYELLAGWIPVRAAYRVVKAPNDDSDDYEVECVSHPGENTAITPTAAALTHAQSDSAGDARDAERLDWLEVMGNAQSSLLLHCGGAPTGRLGLGLKGTGRTIRQAIDDARYFTPHDAAIAASAAKGAE